MSEIYPEGTAIDILEQFAKKTDRDIYKAEKPFDNSILNPVTYHIRRVAIPDDSKKEIFYISYGNSREFGKYANFSGVFFPVDLPLNTEITVRNRDILDKINPFLKESDFKSEENAFNSKVVIEENNIFTTKSIFAKKGLLEIIPKIFTKNQALIFGINGVKIDFTDEFKGKSHMGLYILDDWIINASEIESLFEQIRRIKTAINF